MKPIVFVAVSIFALASSKAYAQAAPSSSSSSTSYALGFKNSDATPSTFKQKNTYVAADDPSTYYGGNLGNLSLNSVLSAVVTAATSNSSSSNSSSSSSNTTVSPATAAAASAFHTAPGTNQILNESGAVVATYDAVSGQFTDANGVVVQADSADYETYKAVLANATSSGTLIPATETASR